MILQKMRIHLLVLLLAGLWCWAINAINKDKGLNPEDVRERDRVRVATNRSFLAVVEYGEMVWFLSFGYIVAVCLIVTGEWSLLRKGKCGSSMNEIDRQREGPKVY